MGNQLPKPTAASGLRFRFALAAQSGHILYLKQSLV